ncbi:MAG: rod shape-determining protein MreD [SAR324 cluster bacterium]|nr:rod shape-determining protein MreD [SAR324 cluster bacterium]MCZ6534126.1 rod shape-determining protein MreD [SAR324 cluster bacterium]MCZ6558072.1 rod shape-determining protein MreD [SAR324 cluster bacterium]MCZ6627974.1 rod shape-determining protein MreD [SAR324 cluster bacterium]MCZ6645334.1 rod shape-determining protein MreD [SAR324 cluster bacterium]
MRAWIYPAIGLASFWLELTAIPYLSIFGIKPNLFLLTVLVLGLRWMSPWLFVYGVAVGIALDVFSHGMLGVYGISFFIISFLAIYVGSAIYENTLWFTMVSVAGLTLAEGLISISIFEILDSTAPWWQWLSQRVLPAAIYHAVLAPFLAWGLIWLERLLKFTESVRPRP